MKVLVTGGAGFIGSHFVERLLQGYDDTQVVVLDALTYAGSLDNLAGVWDNPRFSFWQGNITDRVTVERLVEQAEAVVHFAATSRARKSCWMLCATTPLNDLCTYQPRKSMARRQAS